MTDGRTDEELMMDYAAGDPGAFDLLYGRHRGPLYRFVLRALGSNSSRADEVFQDTWLRAISARASYRPSAKFRTWLYQIANNLVIDLARRDRRTPLMAEAESALAAVASSDPEPDTERSRFEVSRDLQRALEALPVEQRTAFLLWAESDFGPDDIASATGVGRETAKSRLRYALARLREALGR
jgi:RNA polymerase sigma-70 factor (ECF subfamily)